MTMLMIGCKGNEEATCHDESDVVVLLEQLSRNKKFMGDEFGSENDGDKTSSQLPIVV